jgi:hypothetical protein
MSAQPDRVLMRAVAEVFVAEERERAAADRELAADLARARERIDEYGNVIETRFQALEHRVDDVVASRVASLDLKDGAAGPPGAPGPAGEPGEPGPAGPPGPEGPIPHVGVARGLWNAEAVYRALDVVAHNGNEWRALRDDPGPLPGDGWMLGAKGMKGERGDRGQRGERGEPGQRGQDGVGIKDIVNDGGVLVFVLSDGQRKEFVVEVAA